MIGVGELTSKVTCDESPTGVNPSRREDGRVRPLSLARPRMTITVTGVTAASGNPGVWKATP
ncbi:hypothetical protein Aca07nite_62030 [Actinoplanes capillaceus]|uniref:Uncharacterized protein n=1 Tax=Actinoplanes campanulatus TaxID=113559 RepID=A0ABQ3WRK9_9ACTN|nr:hypothetical protein Aca07nite_62030 [Actinoplanes capillaceus]